MKTKIKRIHIAIFIIMTIAITFINYMQGYNLFLAIIMSMLSAALCCIFYQIHCLLSIVMKTDDDDDERR